MIAVVLCVCNVVSCSLCSTNLDCWSSFHAHFKSLHGIDMQQCVLCCELVPRGVLMVQHVTLNHLVCCSVLLRRTDDEGTAKLTKKLKKKSLSHTGR